MSIYTGQRLPALTNPTPAPSTVPEAILGTQ